VVKPPSTQRVTSVILNSKVISLPQPPYPMMAKQTRTQGPVHIQILVDEQGKVISAQVVSGHPMLNPAAREGRHARPLYADDFEWTTGEDSGRDYV
jgi:TonB family protein